MTADDASSSHTSRESIAARTFVQLADSLVEDFDLIELLTVLATRGVELLGASAAGILLADEDRNLRVMAASNEQIELLQIQNDEGPCLDCYRAGQAVIVNDLRVESAWPTSQASRSRKTARLSALREMHLQHALDSRVVIEQAKGMLAAHASLPMEEAFARLRSYARRNNLGLTQVAHDLVGGRRSVDEIAGARPR